MKKFPLYVIFLCILPILTFPVYRTVAAETKEQEHKVIVVGWYEQDGYMREDSNGQLTGFGIDYLEAIARYTGWEYRFVKGSRKQCLNWLESGKIDLMSPVSTTLELGNAKTARVIIGDDYGYIYKPGNNFSLSYGDARQMRNVTLGIKRDSGMEENFERYCKENGITFYDIIYFDSVEEMQKQLVEEKIDAMVTDSFVNLSNMKVIGRFFNGQVTFASADDEILAQLNRAMEEIKMHNPGFTDELREMYFAEASHNHLEYTWEEKVFLNTRKEYDVVLCANQYPVCYQTEKEYKGIAIDVLKKIEHHTGLTFNLHFVDSYIQGQELLEGGKADILGSYVLASGAQEAFQNAGSQSGKEYTTQFYTASLALVGKRNLKMEDALKVAVPRWFTKGKDKLKILYPQYEYISYENDTDCFEAILNKEVDAAVQFDSKVNEFSVYKKYNEIQNLKYIPGNYAVSFIIYDESGILPPVMGKAIDSISETSRAAIEKDNIQHISIDQLSFWDFIVQYKLYLLVGILTIIFLTYGFGYYRKYKRELENKEIAYKDSVADISSMQKFRLDVTPIIQGHEKDKYYALAVDVDKFKVINDLYGYEQGDRVIVFLARMLKKKLTQKDYITRNHADNFVIFKYSESVREVEEYLKAVFAAIEEVLAKRDTHYHLVLKAGIYHLEGNDGILSSIIDKANLAKGHIAHIHKSTYRMYEEHMRQQNIDAKYLENEMQDALKTGQFCIYLQPQVDFKTKKVVSAEALVRWNHPRDGMIPPFRFLPVFEKNGFINRLDFYVWEQAIKTIARWREQKKHMVPIAINLSRVDVQNDNMAEELRGLMNKYGLESRWIKTELTESICVEGDELMLERMQELKKLGLKIAVDDFGSGYSSLHMLKKMPIDILKIDKSFLDFDLDMDIRDEIVIRDIVEMGKHLDLQTIAEGVETKEQSDFLENIGCDIAQGYFYGKPMPVEEFEDLLLKEYGQGGAC